MLSGLEKGSPLKEPHFDLLGFVKAVETGEDIRPYLEVDKERENNVRVLITPDFSGSCHWRSETTGNFVRAVADEDAVRNLKNYQEANPRLRIIAL